MDVLHIAQWLGILVVSIFVLTEASDHFTEAAEEIGLFMRLPYFVIGVTIVAIGTSLPELISSLLAVSKGSSEIVVGNVVGSNIANILFILGISAIAVKNLRVSHEQMHVDLSLFVGSALLFTVTIWDGYFSVAEGVVFTASILVYLWYLAKNSKRPIEEVVPIPKRGPVKALIVLAVSSVFIFLGAEYTIDSVLSLSALLNIGTEMIAISAVAFGTSLPELMVSLSAIKKGKTDMVAGNILGSNIFNTLVVMGIPALMGGLIVPSSILTLGVPMMLLATFFYFFAVGDKGLSSKEGTFFVILYFFFIGKLFGVI